MQHIVLERFMIFNPGHGHEEGHEREKLLYHWTKNVIDHKVDLAKQIDDICLCDASITASTRLNPKNINQVVGTADTSNTCRAFETFKKKRLILKFPTTLILMLEVEPEQSIWMAVHVNLCRSNDGLASTTRQTLTNKQSDCCNVIAAAVEKVIINIYAKFCLLNGTFQMIADEVLKNQEEGYSTVSEKINEIIRIKIRSICQIYFDSILPEIHLGSIISNVALLYNYIIYLDLNLTTLMKVNSFINHLVCLDATKIRYTIAIFNDQLIWSSLNMHDTRLLYNYLVSVLIKDALQEELSREVDKVRRIKEDMPIFLSDVMDETNDIEETIISEVRLHRRACLKQRKKLIEHFITVFRSSNNMTLGLIFNHRRESDLIQKCEQFLTCDPRLGVVPLASLAQMVGQNFLKTNSSLTSTTSASQLSASSSIGSSGRRRQSVSGLKSMIPNEHKYLCLDRLNASVTYPSNLEAPVKDQHLLVGPLDSSSADLSAGTKKMRLIKYLLELEPEFHDIKQQTKSTVEEFFGRTTSDTWLTVTQSQYRSIYSIYKMRNAGLSEAQQSAINLKALFSSSHA